MISQSVGTIWSVQNLVELILLSFLLVKLRTFNGARDKIFQCLSMSFNPSNWTKHCCRYLRYPMSQLPWRICLFLGLFLTEIDGPSERWLGLPPLHCMIFDTISLKLSFRHALNTLVVQTCLNHGLKTASSA